jgi:branched-chain amino acid aminotransferase/4-amino-4-deoxychorismate lyase
MKAIFNKEIINDQKLILNVDDRAIQYGDGIFETIIIRDRAPDLLDFHYQRLKEGAKVLGFNLPDYFTKQNLQTSILQLIKVNKLNNPVRIKVQVWRSSGGFYEPHSCSSNILLTVRKHSDQKTVLKNVGILSSVKNYLSPYSQFKTSNALKYILGSIEKQKSNYDDMIILDTEGHVSELLYSNIFWIKKEIFYTPSLDTGCVRGVMRSFLIDKMMEKGGYVEEIKTFPDRLNHVDHVFATNAAGFMPITRINGRDYEIYPDLNEIMGSNH